MANYVTTGQNCGVCGVEVRAGSQFCYNCGKPVPTSDAAQPAAGAEPPGPTVADAGVGAGTRARPGDAADTPAATNGTSPSRLTSAASLREKKKRAYQAPAKIRWETPEGQPMMFYVAAALIAVVTAVLIALALYLK